MQGETLKFVRQNWHPTVKDDLELTYGYVAPLEHTEATAGKDRGGSANK